MRATHHGTCQLCGHGQLLPGGRLSIHGYAVRWSQFVGRCPGSQGLPFEQSTDLIEAAIRSHQFSAKSLRESAAAMRADASGNTIPLLVYVPATWKRRHSSHVWVDATVQTGDGRDFLATFADPLDGKTRTESLSRNHGLYWHVERTLPAVISHYRGLRADALDKAAAQHDRYVTWQQDRIANWKPTELRERAK